MNRGGGAALMAMGAVIGVPLGTFVLRHADPLLLRWLIAALASSMLLLLLSGWRYHGTPRAPITTLVGAIGGLDQGAERATAEEAFDRGGVFRADGRDELLAFARLHRQVL